MLNQRSQITDANERKRGYRYKFLFGSAFFGILIMIYYYCEWTHIQQNDIFSEKSKILLHQYKTMKQMTQKKISTGMTTVRSKELLSQRTYDAIHVMTDEQRERFEIMGEFCVELSEKGYNDTLFSQVLEHKYDNVGLIYMRAFIIDVFEMVYSDNGYEFPKNTVIQFGDIMKNIGKGKYDVLSVSNMLSIMDDLAVNNSFANESVSHFERQITLEGISKEIQNGVNPQKLNALFGEVSAIIKPENIKPLPIFGELFISVSHGSDDIEIITTASCAAINENDVDEFVTRALQEMIQDRFASSVIDDLKKLRTYGTLLKQIEPEKKMDIQMLNKLADVYNKMYLLDGPFMEFRFLVLNLLN